MIGLWSNNLRDTDAALEDFYQSCALAGPKKCAIHENTAAGVKKRVDRLLDKLRTEPVSFHEPIGPGESRHNIVDYSMTREVMLAVLYSIHSLGTYLADALAALERSDGSLIYAASGHHVVFDSLLMCQCPPGAPRLVAAQADVLAAIACGDTDGRNETVSDLRTVYEELAQTSSFGELWLPRTVCS